MSFASLTVTVTALTDGLQSAEWKEWAMVLVSRQRQPGPSWAQMAMSCITPAFLPGKLLE